MRVFLLGLGVLGLFFGVILCMMSATSVPVGSVGVLSMFGKVDNTVLNEGLHFVNPFASVTIFDAKEKDKKYSLDIPTQDQMVTTMDISVQYRLIREMAASMLQETGSPEQVLSVHMEPKVRSLVRELGKSVERAELLFKQEVQQRLQSELYTELASLTEKGIKIQTLLIRKVKLPDIITNAVNRKKQMAQEAEAEKEALNKFKVEQERKKAEAQAAKEAELIQAQKEREVQLIKASARLDAAKIDAEALLVEAEAEAEAKQKQVDVLGVDNYVRLKAMETLPELANGNHIMMLDGNSSTPLPFLNMDKMLNK